MDLEINDGNSKLKVRANGVIVHDNKVLMCKIKTNEFWCCPGGHIHLNEDSKHAVLREIKEEVELDFDDAELIMMMESFFVSKKGKHFHELGFYYLMQGDIPENKLQDWEVDENDEGKIVHLIFKWFDIQNLDDIDIRPGNLKQILKDKDYNLKHVIRNDD